jgi:hypothetical protein
VRHSVVKYVIDRGGFRVPTSTLKPSRHSDHDITFRQELGIRGVQSSNISHSTCFERYFLEGPTVMAGPDPLNQSASADSPSKQPTSNSCVVCHNRKVKCDRQDPCSNCAKADVECIYRAPLPPRRRKRDETGSVSQGRGKSLRRMEPDGSGSATPTPNRGQMGQTSRKSGSGRMIMKDGNSVYLDT